MKPNRTSRFLRACLACLILSAAGTTALAQSKTNLVLYLPLDSLKQQQIKDFSGNHNDGKTTGIVVSNSPSLVSMQQTRQFSFAVWIKPESLPYEFPVVFSKGNTPGGESGGYEFVLNANRDHDLVFVSGPVSIYTGPNWISNHLGEWIHIAFTLDDQAKTASFYVNGQPAEVIAWLNQSSDINFDVPDNLYIQTLPPSHDANRSQFDGRLRDLKFWNTALSSNEVLRVYEGTQSRMFRGGSSSLRN